MIHYVNGSFVAEEDASISIGDLGILRGYGVFDYIQIYDGQPFHFDDHLFRLKDSAEKVEIELPVSLPTLRDIGYQIIESNGCSEGALRYVVTGGTSEDHMTPRQKPTLIVMYFPCRLPESHYYEEGMKVITTNLIRSFPNIKTTNYTTAILALKQAKARQADDALYLNHKQEILEATTSNFFAFKNGALITSDGNDIVKGITRNIVLQLASEYFTVHFRSIHYEEIEECEEAFLTSSIKEVMPLVQVNDKKLGEGKVGEKSLFLQQLFKKYVKSKLGLQSSVASPALAIY